MLDLRYSNLSGMPPQVSPITIWLTSYFVSTSPVAANANATASQQRAMSSVVRIAPGVSVLLQPSFITGNADAARKPHTYRMSAVRAAGFQQRS